MSVSHNTCIWLNAGSKVRSFDRDINSKLKIMSLEVDSACGADYPKGRTRPLNVCNIDPHIAEFPLEASLLQASPADIRKWCVCPPVLRKLRTYDFVFSNDAGRNYLYINVSPFEKIARGTWRRRADARLGSAHARNYRGCR